ncbi:MAG: hypothetical protein HOG70_00015 [Elusimicrobiaceae bacterium]|nr:hypothetical protein [Elusimicrobiaceae bacterium]
MKFIEDILKSSHDNGQSSLSEAQVYKIFNHLKLNTPKHFTITPKETFDETKLQDFDGDKVVIKVCSNKDLHKTDKGGVKVCKKEEAVKILQQMVKDFPACEEFLIIEFFKYPYFALGQEIMLGARADDAFGSILSLGIGGTDAEYITKTLKTGTSPSIQQATNKDWKNFVENSWIFRYTGGTARGGKEHASLKDLTSWCDQFSSLMNHFSDFGKSDFCIEEIEINPLAAEAGKLVALDGVLRFRKAIKKPRTLPTSKGINAIINPKTSAVAGVSADKMNLGRIILNNITQAGFDKNKTYILKENCEQVDGIKCIPSCKDFPEIIDMFVVAVPSKFVPAVIKDAAESGKVRGIVLISGGMGEKEGSENVKQEVEDIIEKGKKKNKDFVLSGGNSLGIVSNSAKINTLFISKEKFVPPLGENLKHKKSAFISQSGAFVISVLGKLPHIKPEYSVTVGNQMDITVVDYVNEVVKDKSIETILVYIEGLKEGDGTRLLEAVKLAKKQNKTMIIYKAGRTPTGQKAVMGHTASIAGDYVVAKNLLSQEGAFVVDNFEEFEALTQMAVSYNKPKSGKTFILSNAGFETSGMADNIFEGSKISANYPSEKLTKKMAEILQKYKLDSIVDVRNPLDITPMSCDNAMVEICDTALSSSEYDSLIFSTIPLSPVMKTLEKEKPDIFERLAKISKKYKKPIVVSVSGGEKYDYYRSLAQQNGLAVFKESDFTVKTLEKFI